MSSKSKGSNAERDLIHRFWAEKEWCAIRVAGSGSSQYPSPDILASNIKRRLAIEAKLINKSSKYFDYEEINQLKEFSAKFGAEPWIAIKFKGEKWFFISLEDLKQTKNALCIDLDLAKHKGLNFEELIKF